MRRANYLGAPAAFNLAHACRALWEAWPESLGFYLVGSCIERRDYRDVDVRGIMLDEDFARMFPQADLAPGHSARLTLLNAAISGWLTDRTGLPIDFQFQPQTTANAENEGCERQAIGIFLSPLATEPTAA